MNLSGFWYYENTEVLAYQVILCIFEGLAPNGY